MLYAYRCETDLCGLRHPCQRYPLAGCWYSGLHNSSEIKQSLLDISKDGENPHHIRIKAINSLKDLADKEIVDEMLTMLEDPDNYKYYNEIITLIKSVGDSKEVSDNLRKVAFQAMKNHTGE